MSLPTRAALLLFLLLGGSVPGIAAPWTTEGLDDYWVTRWEDVGGAPSELIVTMTQDRDGYLWLGSGDGLTRFDGFTFQRWDTNALPLAGGDVRTLFVDHDGALWVGFDHGGLSRITGRLVRNLGVDHGLPDASVRAFVQDSDGTIWVGTLAGLFKMTGERFERHAIAPDNPDAAVFSAIYDATGSLFVRTADGIYRRRAGSTAFDVVDTRPIGGTGMQSLCKDSDGHVVTTDPVMGLRILDAPADHRLPPTSGVGLRAVCARNGTIWVGTRLTGLWRIGPSRGAHAPLPARTGLLGQAALSVLEDRDQNVWVASNAGLYRLTPRNVRTLREAGNPTAVAADAAGRMWVGTANGLLQFGRTGAEWTRTASLLPGLAIRSVHITHDGTIWVASTGGLTRLDGTGRSLRTDWGRPYTQITSITSSLDGTVWFYDERLGLFRTQATAPEPVPLASDLRGIQRTVLHVDRRNRLWIVGDGGVEIHGPDGDIRRYTTADGLERAAYRSIFEDRAGIIWLGSTTGISRLVEGRVESITITSVRRTSWVKSILEDRQGQLWLGIDRGGIRLSKASFQNALRTPHRQLTDGFEVFDGLPGTIRALSDGIGARTPNDQLWFTTDEGLAVVDPDTNLPDPGVVPARITAATADDVRLDPSGPARLAAGTSRFHLAWTALDLTTPERVRFRYRLDGVDRDWKEAGPLHEVEYANLGAGTYVFRVAATREGEAWSDAGVSSWEFSIAPHVYQTAWFPILAVMAIASASWALWHFRMVQTRRRFAITLAERARVSREVHDTLLQSLVGVALQCQALADGRDGGPLRDKLVQLRRRIDEHIEEGRELIWNLRSPTLEKYDLVSALRRIANEVVAGTGVQVEFTTSGRVHSCSPRAERELLRIGQEAITNAVRHGRPTVVSVELHFDDDSLHLRVTDDGCGFETSETLASANRHCGLVVMRERAEDIGGQCTITSALGRGTRVDAIAPLVAEAV